MPDFCVHTKRLFLSIIIAVTTSASAAAQEQPAERVLIPIAILSPVPGAHGSLWTSQLLARNTSEAPVHFRNVLVSCGPIPLCPNHGSAPARKTVVISPTGTVDRPAAFIEVDGAEDIAFSLRVQDVSRQRQTWGTEIPVVRGRDLHSRAITLTGVPVASEFRTTLRAYEIDAVDPAYVRVRVFGVNPADLSSGTPQVASDTPLGEAVLRLRPAQPGSNGSPGYLELSDFSNIVPPHSFDLLAIEVAPATPGLRLWAFVAIVNNETQHLTVITPQ